MRSIFINCNKAKTLLSIFIILSISLGLSAQSKIEEAENQDTITNLTFSDNFYIEMEGGTQILFSSDVENLEKRDRLTPSFAISAGKWFTPVFGANIKVRGYSLNGFSTTEGTYTAASGSGGMFEDDPVRQEVTINPDGTYRHFIRYADISLNLYISMINLLTGYKKETFFDIIPSAGIGNMHVFAYKGIPENNCLSGNAGLTGKFHLGPKLDVNINANSVFFDNSFEGRIAGSDKYEYYASASIGIVYYIKSRGF